MGSIVKDANRRFSAIEWLVAAIVMLVLARFFWAAEMVAAEDKMFETIGLGGGLKYLVTAPLAAWLFYRFYKTERSKARAANSRVVRPQVAILAVFLLIVAVALLFVTAG